MSQVGLLRVVGILVAGAMQSGNEKRAVRLSSWCVRIRPSNPWCWATLARVLGEFKGVDQQEQTLRDGLRRCKGSVLLADELAQVLAARERREEARTILLRLVREHADSPEPYVTLASLASGEGSYDEAKRNATEALKRMGKRSSFECLESLAIALLYVPGEKHRAEELLIQATGIRRRDPRPWIMLAVLRDRSDPKVSRQHLTRARRLWRGPDETFDAFVADVRANLDAMPRADD